MEKKEFKTYSDILNKEWEFQFGTKDKYEPDRWFRSTDDESSEIIYPPYIDNNGAAVDFWSFIPSDDVLYLTDVDFFLFKSFENLIGFLKVYNYYKVRMGTDEDGEERFIEYCKKYEESTDLS